MKKSEIKAMNRSFGILQERKSKILDDDRTQKLKERVKEIREHSINNMEDLIHKGTTRLQDNGVEVIYAEKTDDALKAIYSIVHDQSMVAKSKSNTAGEIGLQSFLRIKEWMLSKRILVTG